METAIAQIQAVIDEENAAAGTCWFCIIEGKDSYEAETITEESDRSEYEPVFV